MESGTTIYQSRSIGKSESHSANWLQIGARWRYMTNLTLVERCCNIKKLVPIFEDRGVRTNSEGENFYTIRTHEDNNGLYTVPVRNDIPKQYHGVKVSTPFLIWRT